MMIELSELRDAAQKAFPVGAASLGRDAAWQTISELGWLLIELPEDLGGLGLGADAAATIHFELGRVLSPAPLLPALLGLRAIAAADQFAARQEWIDRICAGEYVPAPLLPANLSVQDGRISGTISGVAEADMASHVVIAMPGLCQLIALDDPAVTVTERPLWDESRRLFDVVLTGYAVAADLTLATGEAADAFAQSLESQALLALAADSLGGASTALDLTVEYLKVRKQFDRPLAMFQALKHRCADLKTAVVAGEALLWDRAGSGAATLAELGALKAHAAEVFAAVCEESIQLHGGIGLTSEHPCHTYMKRAQLNLHLCGSADRWYELAGRTALGAV